MLSKIRRNLIRRQARSHMGDLLEPFDRNWFKGKRVAVIGGADSVLVKKNGSFIDGFDVVVRVNKGVELIEKQSEYVGSKTDVLFHSFLDNPKNIGHSPITPGLWARYKVKRLVYALNCDVLDYAIFDVAQFLKKTNYKSNFSQVPRSLFNKNIECITPYFPTTGFTAFNTIFNCIPKELYITGITFFRTPHNQVYRSGSLERFEENFQGLPGQHNPQAEFIHFRKLYLENKDIIIPDFALEQLLKEE